MVGVDPTCFTCGATMAEMISDGVRRLVCPDCGPKVRRGRPRTQYGMHSDRIIDPSKYGRKARKIG